MGTPDQSLNQAVEEARQAQAIWRRFPVAKRAAWLKQFQKLLVKKSDVVIEAIGEDTGKPVAEALGIELAGVLLTADYYRKKAEIFLKPERATPHWMFKNKRILVEKIPHGIVGILGPSNLPFSLTLGDAIPALMAGNAVIIKPSEWTPRSAEVGTELAFEAGLPAKLLQTIQGDADIGAKLIELVDCIFFTGSTNVGKKVAVKAAELLKPCILELGGKAPMIVLQDADIDRAARACVWGRFAHSGQHCIAIERVYVSQRRWVPFLEEVIRLTKNLKPEELSPLKLPNAPQHLQSLIDDALAKGAQIAWQSPSKEKGPTILVDVNHSMRVMKEEAFGPLLPIMTFQRPEEALKLANESDSGLSAVIFTGDQKAGMEMARKLEAGNVSINDCMDHFMIMDAPFGGWKKSGLGVRHGREGLLQFTRPQTIFLHQFPLPFCSKREFWWFPYNKKVEKILKTLNRFFFG